MPHKQAKRLFGRELSQMDEAELLQLAQKPGKQDVITQGELTVMLQAYYQRPDTDAFGLNVGYSTKLATVEDHFTRTVKVPKEWTGLGYWKSWVDEASLVIIEHKPRTVQRLPTAEEQEADKDLCIGVSFGTGEHPDALVRRERTIMLEPFDWRHIRLRTLSDSKEAVAVITIIPR